MEIITDLARWLVDTIGVWGYTGIFVLMAVESSFIPFPSEVVMPPAGYLAAQGKLSFWGAVAAGTGGSVVGALVNYGLALWLGRRFVQRYGRYVLLPQERFERVERFFQAHGAVSTFTGRLVAGIRQYISLPAGLTRMHLGWFVFYTAAGAGLWVWILTWIGWLVGRNQELLQEYLHSAAVGGLFAAVGIVAAYVLYRRRARNRSAPP